MDMKVRIPHLSIHSAVLDAWPLPAESITRGSPLASGAVLSRSEDNRKMLGVWHCTPGQFHWDWCYDETVFVVAGRATVKLSDGRSVELRPGDMAFFANGDKSTWTIHETLLKGFHADAPEPLPF